MASTILGTMSEFSTDVDDFTEWTERLEQWYIANKIDDGDRKRALFLSLIGSKGYKLVRSLCQNEPSTKTYDELKVLTKEHLQPKPNEIAERYVFYNRGRKNGESIKDYVAELRRLSEHCNFGDKLNEHIRDKLVCGLNEQKIQQKLLSIKNLNLQTAISEAITMEMAAVSARELLSASSIRNNGGDTYINSSLGVNKISAGTGKRAVEGQGRRECYRCGSNRHLADGYPFKLKECFGCKQIGHIKKKCRSGSSRTGFKGNSSMSSKRVNCYKTEVIGGGGR